MEQPDSRPSSIYLVAASPRCALLGQFNFSCSSQNRVELSEEIIASGLAKAEIP
jgi:hypothetical protein